MWELATTRTKESCRGQSHFLSAGNTALLFQLVPGWGYVFPLHSEMHHKSLAANLAPAGKTRGKMRVELGLAFSVYIFVHHRYNPDAHSDQCNSHVAHQSFTRATKLKTLLLIEMIFGKSGNKNRLPKKQKDQKKKSQKSFREASESASFQGVVFATSTNWTLCNTCQPMRTSASGNQTRHPRFVLNPWHWERSVQPCALAGREGKS